MKTVLTVDDSKVVRSMVSHFIKPWGCKLIEAADGRQGVEAAREHKPDLILLDITMPVMDGREALAALRKDPECNKIPVIMLTAESGKDTVIEVTKLGVAGYIVKPFQKETFEKGVSKVLGDPAGASGDATLRDKAKRAGHQGVIDKPFHPDEPSGQVVTAAAAMVPPDELLAHMLSEERGCSVLALPGSKARVLVRIIPAVARELRGLAEDGSDKLIVDIGDANEASTELVAALRAIVNEAANLGIRVAICTPNHGLIKRLRELGDLRHSPCGHDREAARATLQ